MHTTRMMSSTSNFHTILKPQPNQRYGVVFSTPFPFIDPLNISHQTPKISRSPLISWPNIFKINKSAVVRQTTSTILIAWAMPFETSFWWYTKLDRMHYTLIKNLIHSGQKFLQNLPQEFHQLMAITRRRFQNQSLPPSIKLHPFPLYWPNPRRRSMSSPNTSNLRKPLTRTMFKGLMSTQEYLMPRLPNLQSARMRF